MSEPTNCMDCDVARCILVRPACTSPAGNQGLLCEPKADLVWSGVTYPTFITPPDWCPLGKEQPQ